MKPVNVGIIGHGKYGTWFENFFKERSCTVYCSDNSRTNLEIIERSNVVLFALPISIAVDVMTAMAPFARDDQLWLDITSLKEEPVRAMLKSNAEVAGLHPLCAPPAKSTLEGQVIAVYTARIQRWSHWLRDFLIQTRATIKLLFPDDHDRRMSIVQALEHELHFLLIKTMRQLGITPEQCLAVGTPNFRATWEVANRIMHNDPGLCADIQMLNPYGARMREVLEEAMRELHTIIELDERDTFSEELKQCREYLLWSDT